MRAPVRSVLSFILSGGLRKPRRRSAQTEGGTNVRNASRPCFPVVKQQWCPVRAILRRPSCSETRENGEWRAGQPGFRHKPQSKSESRVRRGVENARAGPAPPWLQTFLCVRGPASELARDSPGGLPGRSEQNKVWISEVS